MSTHSRRPFRRGPRAKRHGNRRRQHRHQFPCHFNIPFKLFLFACGSAGRLAPPTPSTRSTCSTRLKSSPCGSAGYLAPPWLTLPFLLRISINSSHAVASSGCLWRCLSRRASKNSRNVLYCAAIASLIACNSFVASVSIVNSFHFKRGAYFRWNQTSLFYRLSY